MWARVLVAGALVVGAGCAGKSRSSSDGASGGNGGSSGSGAGGGTGGTNPKLDCDDERRALRNFLNVNKSCTDTSECTASPVGCGVTEDDCTGAVYTNTSVDPAELEALRERYLTCFADVEGLPGCITCDRVPRPPACEGGLCIGAAACALEAAALWDFKSRNAACEVDDDCIAETIGCDVTEDDCTGAVYFAKDVNRAELAALRDEYYACKGACGACLRVQSPPACVSGHCVIRPIR